MKISAVLLVLAGLAGVVTPAAAQQNCPSNFTGYRDNTSTFTCTCPARAATGSVWGTLTYTDDSSICAAAVHAGAIPASGGEVTLRGRGACPSFQGSSRNGITTADYGPWQNSFYFPAVGGGKCGASASGGAAACPANFTGQTQPLTCTCPAGMPTGVVWGTLTYTDDSSICAAAVHSGAVTSAGGEVTVNPAAGCRAYAGSAGNGVTTSNYGTWNRSFFFPAIGAGKC